MTSPGKPSPFHLIPPLKNKQVALLAKRHRLIDPTRKLCGGGFLRRPCPLDSAYINVPVERRLMAAAMAFVRARAKVYCWGIENVPEDGPFILANTHITQLDVLIPMGCMHNLGRYPRFMAKAEILRWPLIGGWLSALAMQPVKRRSGKTREIESDSIRSLVAGQPLSIWPEGTLTRDPDKWPMTFKLGMAEIALTASKKLGYPVPLLVAVTWGASSIRNFAPFPRKNVVLAITPPVEYGDLLEGDWEEPPKEKALELNWRVHRVMEGLEGEIRGEKPPAAGVWDYHNSSRHALGEEEK
ncbi:MAG: 1-acyl-sn-glycerol-3-phosphate acyltransferase [Aeriscardovia sp.]|nr:1-acyl-sn-glycerol-3-phosphate acyltransferase [Aeriscardovia sp.]